MQNRGWETKIICDSTASTERDVGNKYFESRWQICQICQILNDT